ncbi:MarR family EPS-associated transcriptional regulator [Thermodesulfobacteriota bacterium]
MNSKSNHEISYQIFRILSKNPNLNQRQMAKEMGLSLGKFNFCLKELVKKGFVKINRFKSSDNKAKYMYILTPKGIEAKTKITVNFLKRKMSEFEKMQKEIEELKREIEQ